MTSMEKNSVNQIEIKIDFNEIFIHFRLWQAALGTLFSCLEPYYRQC